MRKLRDALGGRRRNGQVPSSNKNDQAESSQLSAEDPFSLAFPDGVDVLQDCPDATVDICFVHGLTGDRASTWTAHGQSNPWPKTLLPPKLNTARILTYGYDAYVVRKSVAGSNHLIDHATNLLNDLTIDRDKHNAASRPIIFVAHSLGGLVCKKAILRSRNNPDIHLRTVFDCMKGIIFIGTPHKGSWMADWAKISAGALGLVKSTNKSLLEILQIDNQLLEAIQVDFWSMVREMRENGRRLEVTCFFEELPLPMVGKVVSKESATLEGYNMISIHANHSDMVRFSSADDNGFKRVLGERTSNLIDQKIDLTHRKSDLDRLQTAKGAAFDSYENQHDECLPGTRIELLREIEEWATSADGKCIFWLNGMAGTGKSTISRTVASRLKVQRSLAGSFFFKRGEDDRGNAKHLFPTLAEQLVTSIPQMAPNICKAIKDDPNISEKALREQFDKLILQPLLEVEQGRTACMVIVIDALDECEQENDIRMLLQFFPQVPNSKPLRLRFLLTSRPEWPIRLGFKRLTDNHRDFVLHEIPKPTIERDISLYFKDKFLQLRQERSLPPDWPGNETIKVLVERAVPLFISATTLYRFISDKRWMPEKRLSGILADETVYMSTMDSTYMPVLNQLLTGQDDEDSQRLVQEFKEIVGAIVLLASPLSVNALARLLNLEICDISNRLSALHSVLDIPYDLNTPVRPLHLSFRDFLLDSKKKDISPFWVDKKEMHTSLTIRCLEVMRHHLKKNICNLSDDGVQRMEIDVYSISCYLPPELQYSCRYWGQHLIQSQHPVTELVNAHPFLELHFLHWVEAMSILGMISDVVEIINSLQLIIQDNRIPKMSEFLYDARRFILKNRQIADIAPLQLYSSGLVFAPRTSRIRNIFNKDLPYQICRLPKTEESWSTELQTLEGHSARVQSVAFSPDGRLLASSSEDKTIKLWNTTTGALQQTLENHSDFVQCVAFSLDGQLLASCSQDKTVKLWDTATGSLQQTLRGHSQRVESVVFSPNGQLLASCSCDKTIKLWDIITGSVWQTLEGHLSSVLAVAFSPDGRLLASSSDDKTIKLWDTATYSLRQILKGHSRQVHSVAFSPDSQLLASGSWDKAIKLWNTITGGLLQTLESHSDMVQSVAFSPDGQFLASSSSDKTIKIWDTATYSLRQILEGHSYQVHSVAFSPDSQLLASCSEDSTVKLWDTSTSSVQQILKGYLDPIQSVTFSLGSQLLASCSSDNTVKLWNTTTGDLRQILEGHSQRVESVVFSPDGQLLASGSWDKTVKLWNTNTGSLQQTLENHLHFVQCVIFSLDGQLLASGSWDKTIKLWDATTGHLLQTLKGHSDWVFTVAFSPDGELLASGSLDKTVKLWDATTGRLRQTLKSHSDLIRSVEFSQDSLLLASSSQDNTVKLWITATGSLWQTLTVKETVTKLKFSEDGQYLHTDYGCLNIDPWYDNNVPTSPQVDIGMFILEGQWVVLYGKKVLWLPPEYRGCSAVKDHSLAVGHHSGRISFIEFST